jgi:glycosyltransferase involved in cell wall biosynthesis
MIIGIDGNEANVETKVGISEWAYELLRQLSEYSHVASTVAKAMADEKALADKSAGKQVSSIKYQVYLKTKPREDLPSENTNWKYRVFGPQKLWTQWRLPLDLYLHKPRPSVFFTPSHYAPRFSPAPLVVSVMDLSYIYFPEMFNKSDLYQLKSWTSYSVKKAKAIITISNSSRNDIINVYGIPEENVHVTYPGIKPVVDLEPHIYSMNELKMKYQIKDKYVLFVGTIQPRKNLERLIEAFSLVINTDNASDKHVLEDLQLVIVGKKGWLYESILAAPGKFGISNNVKFLDFVPSEDLPLLYGHAQCFVLPSLYEGFGLPILEAMKYDCPVITSKVSSMPEAGGDAALYVDPTNTEDIAEKIKKLVQSEKLREELIEKGRKQVKKFSWEKTAKETLEILKEVAAREV